MSPEKIIDMLSSAEKLTGGWGEQKQIPATPTSVENKVVGWY